jgi:signal transduction histidine kinase/ABC-type phosphate/phosphonate transport system substrate-binding protein
MKAFTLISTLALLLSTLSSASAEVVNIGLLNHRDNESYQAFWRETARTLSSKIPGYTFVIKPLGLECLTHAISKQQLHFAITSSAQAVLLEKNYHSFPIATLQSLYKNHAFSHYGAAIITKTDRDDINGLADLKGQHFIAASPYEFGGYQMVWRQLQEAGIDPQKDFFELFFTNDRDEDIVRSIVEGKADAAAIQSGTIERLIDLGELSQGQIKVLHPESTPSDFPAHSTILYPEWSFIGLENTDIALAKRIADILLSMPKQTTNSTYIPAYAWTKPADPTTVHGLLRALKLPPYAPVEHLSLKDFLLENRIGAGSIFILILMLLFFNARMRQINRQLAFSQSELAIHRDNLEKEVQQRTQELYTVNAMLEQDIRARRKIENTLRRSQTVLQGFYQILVHPDLDYLKKLHQLMQLAKNHFKMDAVFLYRIQYAHHDGDVQKLALTAHDGDILLQDEITQCLHERYLSSPIHDLQSYYNNVCNKRMIILPVNVNDKLHSLLVFAGHMRSEQILVNVDKELLRLMTQWIRSSIERHDIEEEREKYRLQLGKVARLYTMGEMASGLAHEINQPLTAATNYVSGSLLRLREGAGVSEVENGLHRSLLCLNQTTAIIRRLREFVQTGVPRDEVFDFTALIERVLDLLKTEARQKQIALIHATSAKTFWVNGDRVQLEQVMLNLVRNAIDACDAHGEVDIEVSSENDFIQACVRDTGIGIDAAEIAKIFDPFHTSKPFGMGLGLAICRSIIEAHGSTLKVESLNPGTVFSFKLPKVEKPLDAVTQQP